MSTLATERDELVRRLIDLRPQLQRRFNEEIDRTLHEEIERLTIHQLSVLQSLTAGPLQMRELAHRLGISESSATAAVDRLVRVGLVARGAEPSDRRVVLVGLSEEGTGVVTRVQRASRQRLAQMLSVLSDPELASLVAIYETIVGATADSSREVD